MVGPLQSPTMGKPFGLWRALGLAAVAVGWMGVASAAEPPVWTLHQGQWEQAAPTTQAATVDPELVQIEAKIQNRQYKEGRKDVLAWLKAHPLSPLRDQACFSSGRRIISAPTSSTRSTPSTSCWTSSPAPRSSMPPCNGNTTSPTPGSTASDAPSCSCPFSTCRMRRWKSSTAFNSGPPGSILAEKVALADRRLLLPQFRFRFGRRRVRGLSQTLSAQPGDSDGQAAAGVFQPGPVPRRPLRCHPADRLPRRVVDHPTGIPAVGRQGKSRSGGSANQHRPGAKSPAGGRFLRADASAGGRGVRVPLHPQGLPAQRRSGTGEGAACQDVARRAQTRRPGSYGNGLGPSTQQSSR